MYNQPYFYHVSPNGTPSWTSNVNQSFRFNNIPDLSDRIAFNPADRELFKQVNGDIYIGQLTLSTITSFDFSISDTLYKAKRRDELTRQIKQAQEELKNLQ